MKKQFSARSGRPAGQALPEFAGVAATFLLLLFAITEMGIVVYRYNSVSQAAREAARYAIVHGPTSVSPATDGDIEGIAEGIAPFLSSTNFTTPFFVTDPNDTKQKDAKISISYNYAQFIPFMSSATLTFTSTSQMLVSQ
jgi:Flp pilus assembly protein TadG